MLTRPSRFLAPGRFHPDIFHDDLETLISFYKQNGFLQARIIDTLISRDSIKNQVDIFIDLGGLAVRFRAYDPAPRLV